MVVSLESDYKFHLTLSILTTAFAHKPVCCTLSSEVATRGTHTKSALSGHYLSQDSLRIRQHHFQYNWGTTRPPVHCQGRTHTRDCTPSERALGRSSAGASSSRNSSTGPRALFPATRFLEEDLVPSHFDFSVDSDRDHLFPHSLTQTVTHTLRLGNLKPLLTPVTQISAIPEERDPNNDTPTRDPPAPELLPSQ